MYRNGIYLWYSNHNKLTDLNVHSNGRHGILTEHSEYVFIANVNTYSNGWHGIRLGWYPNHSVITNCNASFNDLSGIHPSDWPTNVTITNCTASWNGGDGIWLGWTTDGLIRDCTVHDNGRYGIRLDTDRYCTVADCYVESNAEGIRVYIHSSYYIHNTITNCDLESNDYGIIVCHRGGYGIWYLDTTIKNCDIRNNEYGISVSGNGSKIYHNNLIDNTIQARDNGFDNTWDDGYPVGGNYWSDYNGTDLYNGASQNQTGSDGIGDTPYIINEDNMDTYPLMGSVGSLTMQGENVTVFASEDVGLIFENVTTEGFTTVNKTETGPEPPSGFRVEQYYDIETTAGYSGTITIRIIYDDSNMTQAEEENLQLMQWNETTQQWVDITVYVDVENNLVIGETSHLSIFGVTWHAFAHDITITKVILSKAIVGQDFTLNMNVTIANQGDYLETFSVTVYANATIISTLTEITLTGGNSKNVTFTWNTMGWVKGNYTISAYATPVPGETNTTDNSLVDGWILVTIPGDVDGDRDVDIFDIVAMAGAYGAKTGDSEYELNCDLDGDGDIDIFDIVGACVHYGESW